MTTCDTNCQFDRPKQGCRETRRPPQRPINAPKNEKPPTVEVHKPRGFSASPRRSLPTNPRIRPRSCTKRHEVANFHEFGYKFPRTSTNRQMWPTNLRIPTNLRMSEPLHMVTPCTPRRRPEGRPVAPGSSRPDHPPREATEEERRPPRRITAPSSCTPSAVALVPAYLYRYVKKCKKISLFFWKYKINTYLCSA